MKMTLLIVGICGPGVVSGQSAMAKSPVAPDEIRRAGIAAVEARAATIPRSAGAVPSRGASGSCDKTQIGRSVANDLRAAGFDVAATVAGMPATLIARYGSGQPVIALMSEADDGAADECGTPQSVLTVAASALKTVKARYRLPGTIVVYDGAADGSPGGLGYMVGAGLFDGVDAVLSVRAGDTLGTGYGAETAAVLSAQWDFTGTQAHAAWAWRGRSALDAVEIMNVSTNFMREHVEPSARLSYVIPAGGKQPNVIPGEASVRYEFSDSDAASTWDLFKRTRKSAIAAAQSTDTIVSERILWASWPVNGNRALAELVQENLEKLRADAPGLETMIRPLKEVRQSYRWSGAGDVSWQAPYVRVSMPMQVGNPAGGDRRAVAPVRTATLAGAKGIVLSALELMTQPDRLRAVKADFAQQLARSPRWKSLLPPGAEPPAPPSAAKVDSHE